MKLLKRLSPALLAAALLGMLVTYNLHHVGAQNTTPINMSELRAVNALVGLGMVDVYLDNELIAYGLAPEQATPYLIFPAGKHHLDFRLTGTEAGSEPVATQLIELGANHSHTAIVYQTQFSTEEVPRSYAAAGGVLFLTDDRSPLQLGKTRLTAAHLAPGTPGQLSITYPSRASLLYQIGYQKPYGSVDIDAGVYSLAIADAASPDLTILKRVGDKSLYANTLYTMVIVPDLPAPEADIPPAVAPALTTEPRLFMISAPVEPPQDGIRLRIVHAAHNTAVVDIYIDERLVASRVNYGLGTEYLGLSRYSHTITLRNFGDPPGSPPLARAEFVISEENQNQPTWTLMLLNATGDTSIGLPVGRVNPESNTPPSTTFETRGEPMMMALLPDDVSQTRRGYSRIRLIHALDGFPALSLFASPPAETVLPPASTPTPDVNTTPTPPLEFVRQTFFGSEAGETEVRSGFYNKLDIRIALSSSTIMSLNNLHLMDGLVYTFVVIGSNDGDPPLRVISFADYGSGTQTNRLYNGRIRGTQVNIRALPRNGAPVLTILPRDMEVEVMARNIDGTWVRIRFNDPVTGSINEGWIFSDLLLVTRLGTVVNPRSLPEYTGIEQ